MELTLHVEDALAQELRQEALDERLSVEELARRLVSDALRQRAAARLWRERNRRRLELIAKKMNGPLPAAEQEEFRRLQVMAYEEAAPFDNALLQTVTELRQVMDQLPEDSVP